MYKNLKKRITCAVVLCVWVCENTPVCFFCAYAPMWLCVRARLLSLTFVYIISIASAEQPSVIETRPRAALLNPLSWGTQNWSCGSHVPQKSLIFLQILKILLKFPLKRWNAFMKCVFLYQLHKLSFTPQDFLICHTLSLKFRPALMWLKSVHSIICVYSMFICTSAWWIVCVRVCNFTQRCSQGGISSAFSVTNMLH